MRFVIVNGYFDFQLRNSIASFILLSIADLCTLMWLWMKWETVDKDMNYSKGTSRSLLICSCHLQYRLCFLLLNTLTNWHIICAKMCSSPTLLMEVHVLLTIVILSILSFYLLHWHLFVSTWSIDFTSNSLLFFLRRVEGAPFVSPISFKRNSVEFLSI